MEKQYKKYIDVDAGFSKGITLISLVVTIIIMLILAGVTINLIVGKNGIINHAKHAKESTLMQNAIEKVKLAVLDSYNTDGKILYGNMEITSSLENNINKIEGLQQKLTDNITQFPVIVNVDGYNIQIKENGDVELYDSNTQEENNSYEKEKYEKEKSSLVLLEHFEENYSNNQIDTSKIDINNKKLGNASLSLNNTAIKNSNQEQFNFARDFTIDYWIKLSNQNLNSTWAPMLVVEKNNGIWIGLHNGEFVIRGYSVQDYLQIEPPQTEEWTHIAICRENGTLRVFYNGQLKESIANSINFAAGDLVIGSDGSTAYLYNSYIDELRIINGTAKWNSNFTPTNNEYEDEGILYHFNYNRVSEDTATISTTEKKFGNTSKYFNNTHIIYDEKQIENYDFAGDFTIDFWIKLSNQNLEVNAAPILFARETNGIWIGLYSGKFVVRGGYVRNYLEIEPPQTEEWTHIAICRENGILYVFYNGILQGKIENNVNFAKGKLIIGFDGAGAYLYDSYIDELRILKGYGCWTNNFNVPEKEYQY